MYFFSVLTFPAFSSIFELFEIRYHNFAESFYLNHFTNTLSYLFGIESEFKIIPLNSFGVVLAVLGKISFYLNCN